MSILDKETNLTAIARYIKTDGEIKLNEIQLRLLERWTYAHDQFLKRNIDSQVVVMLINRFGIDHATAYRDIRSTKKLFGDGNPFNKSYNINLLWDLSMKEYNLARSRNDSKGTALHLKNMIELTKMAAETTISDKAFESKVLELTVKPEDVGLEPVPTEIVDSILNEFYNARKEKNLGR